MSADPIAHIPRLIEAMDAYQRALRVPPDRLAVEIDGEARGLVSRAGLSRPVVLPSRSRSVSLRDERGTLRAFALREETAAPVSRCSAQTVDPVRSEQPMTQSEAGSVVVSLAELMTIEDERIEAEEQARVAADQAREQERQQRAHRQRVAEQTRLAVEQQRRLEQRAREREEAARLAALEKATVEQARAAAHRRAQLQVQSEEQKHQTALAALRRDHQIRRLRTWLAAAVAVVVLGGSAGAFLWQQDHMSAELALAAQTTESQKLQTDNARLERDKENALATVKQLKSELADAEREIDRERARADAEKARADLDEPTTRSPLRRPHRPTEQPKDTKCRFRGDPLCGLDGRSAIP